MKPNWTFLLILQLWVGLMRWRGYYVSLEATGTQNERVKRIKLKLTSQSGAVNWQSGQIVNIETDMRVLILDLMTGRWIHFALTGQDEYLTLFGNGMRLVSKHTEPILKYPPEDEWRKNPVDHKYREIKIGWAGREFGSESVPNSYTHIDEVGFFEYAMTQDEIQDIYDNGLAPFQEMSVYYSQKTATTWGHLKRATR